MRSKPLIDLLDRTAHISDFASGDEFLEAVRSIYEARHIAYLCANLPKSTHPGYYVHHSYSCDWASYYETNHCIQVDPIIRAGLTSIIPTDWQLLTRLSPEQRRFLNISRDFGLGRQGLTVSIRGLNCETAIFSINTDHTDAEWATYKPDYLSHWQIIATYFHERICKAQGIDVGPQCQQLTPRELECLKWCAAGKTYADIGTILAISERTVNFHMALSRTKLKALTNAQAVGKAIHLGLIVPG